MLKKVRITNFLSCQDTEIEFDNITALIGRNAAGKTNILKAIEWCAQFAVGDTSLYEHLSEFEALERDLIELKTECSIEFLNDDNVFKYEIEITTVIFKTALLVEKLFYYINGNWQLIAERSNEKARHYSKEEVINFEIKPQASMINSMISLLPEKKINTSINKISDYLSGIRYYTLENEYRNVASTNSEVISGNDYRQWLSKNNKTDSSVIMRLLHLWNEDKELLEELQEIIGENGLNLINYISVLEFTVRKDKKSDCFYTVEFFTEKPDVNYNQLSYGTQRVLILLLALLYDKNNTLLIEQPEDGIHTGLLHKLLPLCFEYAEVYNKQLIITTHSSEAINLFQPENIRLVKMTENGTKVSALDKEQMPFIHDYLKNEGALFDFIKSMNDE
jgi:AAA15 family ATPase/GTPase